MPGKVVLRTPDGYSSPMRQTSAARVERLGLIIQSGPGIGDNVNGPSLIRAPQGGLGRYHLYFAHHIGDHIRLAYADELSGPWTLHPGGVLGLDASLFPTEPHATDPVPDGWTSRFPWHIASPDVHVVQDGVRMYFHGLADGDGNQLTRAAVSRDGLSFEVLPQLLCPSYLRAFRWDGMWYGIVLNGAFWRSPDGLVPFEPGPVLWPSMRHCAVLLRGTTVSVVFSRWGDEPERLFVSTVELHGDWMTWEATEAEELLRPEHDWEGADVEVRPSRPGPALERLHELRDPAIFAEDDGVYLLYSVAGESGIAIARLEL